MPGFELDASQRRFAQSGWRRHFARGRQRRPAESRPSPLARMLPCAPALSRSTRGSRAGGAAFDRRSFDGSGSERFPGGTAAGGIVGRAQRERNFWSAMNPAQHLLVLALRIYRWGISPFLSAVSGPLGLGCRFTPTCSAYAVEAIRAHGAWRGVTLAIRRLGRCHPWGGCGCDPVPPKLNAGISR